MQVGLPSGIDTTTNYAIGPTNMTYCDRLFHQIANMLDMFITCAFVKPSKGHDSSPTCKKAESHACFTISRFIYRPLGNDSAVFSVNALSQNMPATV
jgi:hypothetical protein